MKHHLNMRQILKCRPKNVLAEICEKAKIMAWKIYEIEKIVFVRNNISDGGEVKEEDGSAAKKWL